MKLIKNVVVTGGTHGNELCGLAIAKHFKSIPKFLPSLSFDTKFVITNPEAVKLNRRYKDKDLNRCFFKKDLESQSSSPCPYEVKRARELNELLGPKGTEKSVDCIFDLHNTTANTGILLCFHPNDELALELAGYAQSINPSIRACFWSPEKDSQDVPFLPSLGKSGMTLEVGPVAHGTVDSKIVQETLDLLKKFVLYLEKRNENYSDGVKKAKVHDSITVPLIASQLVAYVDYPRNTEGDITHWVHPDLQGLNELQEGSVVEENSNLFLSVDGEEVLKLDTKLVDSIDGLEKSDLKSGLFPMFINEAAYIEKGIAMMLTKSQNLDVTILSI